MEEKKIKYIQFPDEVSRLRYTIEKFKKYDEKRKRYIIHLQKINDQQSEKIKRLESLTERQHEEIDELMDAYDDAKHLIADPTHKAYVYELLKRATDGSKAKKKCENLAATNKDLHDKNKRLKEQIKSLQEKIEALEIIIKNLHNGKNTTP